MLDSSAIQPPIPEIDPYRWRALAVLLSAAFMNLMDVTIVNVALASMQTNMGATSSQIEWVIAAYVLAFALCLLPFGRLGDIIGKRIVFIVGVAAFTIVSALCGAAPNVELLVFARILQGISAAAIMPQVMALIQDVFPRDERGKAFAFFGITAGTASVAGPLIGGFLIDLNVAGLDWRPIFLINVPLGITVLALAFRYVPKIAGNRELTVDWGGVFFVSVAVFCLVFPLVEGRTFGWPLWIFVMMAASVPSFIAFVLWERFRDAKQMSQLLPFSLITDRNYMVGALIVMFFFSGLPGFFMVLALYFQLGFGLTPFESGLASAPFPLGVFIASATMSRLGARYMRQRLTFGIGMLIVAMIWTRQVVLGTSGALVSSDFIPSLLLSGFSAGMTISVIFQSVLLGVPRKDTGSGSGGLQAFQQIGAAIGIAMIGQIFFSTLVANGGAASSESFKHATAAAIIYDVALFAMVIVLSLFLRAPDTTDRPAPELVSAEM